LLAGDAVVLEPDGLRRKQRRVKKLDAEKKTRRKTTMPVPVKTLQPLELFPLAELEPIAPRKRNGNGNGNGNGSASPNGKAR